MDIASVMTLDPVAIEASSGLDKAMDLMDARGIRHLPVVRKGRLVGVISDRDLLAETGWSRGGEHGSRKSVRDIMCSPPITVTPGESIVSVMVEIVARGIGCLPVVSAQDGSLLGIVTETDLLRAFHGACASGRLGEHGNPLVGEHMTADPIACGPVASLADATRLCRRNFIRHVPVVKGGRLVGVVSDRDIRRAAGAGGDEELTVADCMTSQPLTVRPSDTLMEAAGRMLRHRISCLPVVRGDEFVGIITTTDLVDHCMSVLLRA